MLRVFAAPWTMLVGGFVVRRFKMPGKVGRQIIIVPVASSAVLESISWRWKHKREGQGDRRPQQY